MNNGVIKWELIFEWAPIMLQGALSTIYISILGFILSLLLGLVFGLLRLSNKRFFNMPAAFYVHFVRGIPPLILILGIFFGLPFFGVRVPAIVAGVLALGINAGAYIAEIIRGALEAIDKGQMEAARSLGMSYSNAMRRIILPQIIIVVIPPITGEFNSLVKESSLLSVVAISELTRVGRRMLAVSFRPIESWVPVAAIYYLINLLIARFTQGVENRLNEMYKK